MSHSDYHGSRRVTTRRAIALVVTLLMVLSLFVGCAAPAAAPTAAPAAPTAAPAAPTAAAPAPAATPAGSAPKKTIKLGLNYPFTGGDAISAKLISDATILGLEQRNYEVAGYKIELVKLDNATATAGGSDPAQAATNARKYCADPDVLALFGPYVSGESKAATPIMSDCDLAGLTTAASNPDITDPKFANLYSPKGKTIFFRLTTTDQYVAPAMAKYAAQNLKLKKMYIVDDGQGYGVGVADSFEAAAKKLGVEIVGRDRLDQQESDYSVIVSKVKAAAPDSVFYGGYTLAFSKLAKQSVGKWPGVTKLISDYNQGHVDMAGPEAAEGWIGVNPGPNLSVMPESQKFLADYKAKFGVEAITQSAFGYDSVEVILGAIERVVKSGKELNRSNVRDEMLKTDFVGASGHCAFAPNGDRAEPQMSVWVVKGGKIEFVEAAPN